MTDDIKKDASIRIGPIEFSEEDAHSRVAVLFVVPPEDEDLSEEPLVLIAVSVKWLIVHGVPVAPTTGEPMIYHGTHIIQ